MYCRTFAIRLCIGFVPSYIHTSATVSYPFLTQMHFSNDRLIGLPQISVYILLSIVLGLSGEPPLELCI